MGVPAVLQGVITAVSDDGVAIVVAVTVGVAAIGLLRRAFRKSGVGSEPFRTMQDTARNQSGQSYHDWNYWGRG